MSHGHNLFSFRNPPHNQFLSHNLFPAHPIMRAQFARLTAALETIIMDMTPYPHLSGHFGTYIANPKR
jgi:hypothetical protein